MLSNTLRLAAKEKELNELYANKENFDEEISLQAEEKEEERTHAEDEVAHESKGRGSKDSDEVKQEMARLALLSPTKDVGVEIIRTEMYSPDAKEESCGGGLVEEAESSGDEEESKELL